MIFAHLPSAGEIRLGAAVGKLAIKKSKMGYAWVLLHEIELIRTINHPNVIKAYMWDYVGDDVYMYSGIYIFSLNFSIIV